VSLPPFASCHRLTRKRAVFFSARDLAGGRFIGPLAELSTSFPPLFLSLLLCFLERGDPGRPMLASTLCSFSDLYEHPLISVSQGSKRISFFIFFNPPWAPGLLPFIVPFPAELLLRGSAWPHPATPPIRLALIFYVSSGLSCFALNTPPPLLIMSFPFFLNAPVQYVVSSATFFVFFCPSYSFLPLPFCDFWFAFCVYMGGAAVCRCGAAGLNLLGVVGLARGLVFFPLDCVFWSSRLGSCRSPPGVSRFAWAYPFSPSFSTAGLSFTVPSSSYLALLFGSLLFFCLLL